MDLHHLSDVESMALQRTELRSVHDVRAARGSEPDKSTRQALYGAFVVSYLILFLGFHTGKSADPLFVSLGIPAGVSRWEQMILGVAFVGLSAYGLIKLARQTGWRKLVPSLTLYSSQFLWFLLPAAISLLRRAGNSAEPLQHRRSGGDAFGAVFVDHELLCAAGSSGESREKGRDWRPLAYFGVLIVGGIALFVPGPWLASRAFHHDFTDEFPDLHVPGEHPSLHFGRRDLEAARWTDCSFAAQFAGARGDCRGDARRRLGVGVALDDRKQHGAQRLRIGDGDGSAPLGDC